MDVGVGRSLRTRGCSPGFIGTRRSVLFGEMSRDGVRGVIVVSRVGKSEGRETTKDPGTGVTGVGSGYGEVEVIVFLFYFYSESRNRELKTRLIYEDRYDERLKN